MATQVKKTPQPFVLAGRIRSCDISYHIAQSQERQFSEVLALEILAEIETWGRICKSRLQAAAACLAMTFAMVMTTLST
jgi:hypothetical protein